MAAPMPREAPVTKAISPFSMRTSLHGFIRILPPPAHRPGPPVLQRPHLQIPVLVDAPVQAGQYLARTALHDLGCAAVIMVRTVAAQYTGVYSCLTSPARMFAAVDAFYSTPYTAIPDGGVTAVLSSRTRSFSAAGCMSELCAGTLMGNASARLAPLAVRSRWRAPPPRHDRRSPPAPAR